VIDIHGAQWTGPSSYELNDGAVRYEQYEVNMSAKVREDWPYTPVQCLVVSTQLAPYIATWQRVC
jgi:hypothetical protein